MNQAKLNLVIAMLIFGSIGLFVRKIDVSPAQIVLARSLIGSILLLLVLLILKKKVNWKNARRNLPFLLACGVMLGYNWMFLFKSYQYTTIANATLSYYCAPLIVVALSPIVLKERLTLQKVLCLLVAMAGMVCIAGTGDGENTNHLLGIAYGLAAALLYAGVILSNKFLHGLPAVESTLFQLAITFVAMLPYVLLSEDLRYQALSISGWTFLLIVGVIHTGIVFILFFSSIQKLQGQTIALLSYIDPISAILMSALLLQEKMEMLQIIGGILIIGAALFSEWSFHGKESKSRVL